MKTVRTSANLFIRLGVTAAALLLGQQVMAAGTDAGTIVSNQATVTYDVGTVTQTPIESDPLGNSVPGAGNPTEFLVDRRVNFTLTQVSGTLTDVAPGDASVWVDFLLTNTTNSTLDFNLSVANLASLADVRGLGTDSNDVTLPPLAAATSISVSADTVANGDPDPVLNGPTFVDDLAEDQAIRIRVWADAPLTLVNADVAGVQLDATAADPTTTVNLEETAGADVANQIDNVFANVSGADGNGNATEVSVDGFNVISAALEITKIYTVVAGDLGSGKPIPGATVEYTITVDNTNGDDSADSVTITDIIDPDVTFVDEAYGVGQDVNINGAFCNADATDADNDGCSLDVVGTDLTLVVGDNVDLTIDVAAATSYTITFQVVIPDP